MRKILPSDYCYINDSAIGFTGSFNKISNIGIITSQGKFLNGINIPQSSNQIILYPNPSSNGILFVKGIDNSSFGVSIMNNLGQVVFSRIEASNSKIETKLSTGLYFVKINYKNISYHFKWIIAL
jgi:hypothetical protein